MEAFGLVFALLYAALTGLSIVIDRVVLNDVLDEPGTFLFTSTGTTLLFALLGTVVFTTHLHPPLHLLLTFVLLGLFKALPIYIYFRTIKTADASTIAPIISTQPAITVVLAFFVLGERLAPLEYGGVAILLLGGFLLAAPGLRDVLFSLVTRGESRVTRPAVIAFELALLWSVEALFLKFVLQYTTFWTVFLWTSTVAFSVAVLFLARDAVRSELHSVVTGAATEKIEALAASEIVSSIAGAAMVAAYAYAPVSMVAPVLHTYSAFVFVYVLFLHWTGFDIDTNMSQYQLAHKGLAVLLTAGGLVLLAIAAL